MTTNPAPITNPVVDESGLPTLPWTLFFNQNFEGDPGALWEPNFVNLTGSTSSVTGIFYRLSQYLTYFSINITPDGNTSATSGTTYIDNFPLAFNNDGFNTIVSGTTGGSIGMNARANNRIYVPGWTNVNQPLVILGMVEAT
jgi:hypothetical protein